MMVPGYGSRLPADCARDLQVYGEFVVGFLVVHQTYPLRTPSTCRSIHHTPGMPSTHHWLAFRRTPPAGIHLMRSSQTSQATVKSGMRTQKRKRCHGRKRALMSVRAIGKKGAMPEPEAIDQPLLPVCTLET